MWLDLHYLSLARKCTVIGKVKGSVGCDLRSSYLSFNKNAKLS